MKKNRLMNDNGLFTSPVNYPEKLAFDKPLYAYNRPQCVSPNVQSLHFRILTGFHQSAQS